MECNKKNTFCGEVKDSVIFLFFLLHKRAKPTLPPCPLPPPKNQPSAHQLRASAAQRTAHLQPAAPAPIASLDDNWILFVKRQMAKP
jgi:hypothetical protein